MDKHLFDRAIGEAPPSTVDVDGIVARERRAAWVRRAAVPGVGAAAAVIAVTVGVAVVVGPDNLGGAAPAADPTSATAPPTSATSPPCDHLLPTAPPAPEASAAATARLTAALRAAVQRQLAPGAQLRPKPATANPPRPEYPPLEFVHYQSAVAETPDGGCQGGNDEFLAGATVAWDEQNGSIDAVVARLGSHATPETECELGGVVVGRDRPFCEPRGGPDGEIILLQKWTTENGPTTHQVDVTKPDGTGIILRSVNTPADPKQGGVPQAFEPPFNFDQLIAIGLDPAMTLYP